MFSLTHRERKILLFIGILIFCGAILRFFGVNVNTIAADTNNKNQKQESFPIDINTASSADLEEIPGIGPAIASRIIEYRTNHGKFISPDDLKKIKGIGDKKMQMMKDYIAIQD